MNFIKYFIMFFVFIFPYSFSQNREVLFEGMGAQLISEGIARTYGIQNGEWCCDKVEIRGDCEIFIKDNNGKEIFSEKIPENYASQDGNPWPIG